MLLKLVCVVKVGKVNFSTCVEGRGWVSAGAYCIDITTGRAFSVVGRSLLGVKNCVLVLAITNQPCGLGQNT